LGKDEVALEFRHVQGSCEVKTSVVVYFHERGVDRGLRSRARPGIPGEVIALEGLELLEREEESSSDNSKEKEDCRQCVLTPEARASFCDRDRGDVHSCPN
jgi:hypothetical protein